MKTVILGKHIKNIYSVDCKCKEIPDVHDKNKTITVYYDKPTIQIKTEVLKWDKICSYSGTPQYSSYTSYCGTLFGSLPAFNINEVETVHAVETIFRADLNEFHVRTDKVLSESDLGKKASESNLKNHIEAFNEMMICSNDLLKSYCDLHQLKYKDTDAITLFKIVFPNENYRIVDGRMEVMNTYSVFSSCCGTIADAVTIKTDCTESAISSLTTHIKE